MKKEQTKISAVLISVSFFQMGMVALSPIVSALSEAFPNASQLAAQMANTFLCLVIVLFAVFAGSISRFLGRRKMMIIAMVLLMVAAAGGVLMHSTLWMVYFWSSLIGVSIGLFVPAVNSLLMDAYDDDTRTGVTSLQCLMVGLGGVILSLLTGVLAEMHWSYAYLVFLLAVIPLILAVRNMPSEQALQKVLPEGKQSASSAQAGGYGKVPAFVWLAALQTLVFAIIYFAFSTNISLYMTERGYTSTAVTGAATSAFMLGTCFSSMLLGRVMKLLGRYTPAGAFILLALSYLALFFSGNLVVIFIAALISGGTLGFVFPYFVITAGAKVDPALSVVSSSLIVSIGPNFGSFLSPLILTPLTNALGSANIAPRFLLAAVLAAVVAVILIISNVITGKKSNQRA